MIQVCKQCNRVKVDDEEWSEKPSTKAKPNGKNSVDKCDYCLGKIEQPEEAKEVEKVEEIEEEKSIAEIGDEKEMAHQNHQTLVRTKKLMGDSLLAFADALRESKENGYFKFYNESWEAYLSSPEIGMHPSRGRRLIELSKFKETAEKQLGREVDLSDIAEGRFRKILPCVKFAKDGSVENIKDVEEILSKARTLGHNDFEAEADEYKGTGKTSSLKEPAEKRITEGPIKDAKDNVIGRITSCWANQKKHTLKIVIENDYIPEGPLTIVID